MVLGPGNSVVTVTADLDVAVRVTTTGEGMVIAAADRGDSVRVSVVGDFSDAATVTLD